MGLRTALPIEPHPRARHSPVREGETIRALGEARGLITRIEKLLAPYREREITDASGRRFRVLAADGGNVPVPGTGHPFQVLQQQPSPGTYQYGVIYSSSLYRSLVPDDKQTITGLLSEDLTTGWVTLTAGSDIWLEVTFNTSGVVTAAEIKHQCPEPLTSQRRIGQPDSVVTDDGGTPPVHEKSRKLIAYIENVSGSPVIRQSMKSDQVIKGSCFAGRAAKYIYAHEGGYPL